MSTAEDGGATANTTTSSYGGGGAGGKFRKKPLRRPATPYDRPATSLRVSNTNSDDSSSWLTKLVVAPASKLLSYGADRFFASVFRKRLPPPLPPQPPEENAQESDGDQGEDLNKQGGEQEHRSGLCSQPILGSSSNGVTELEHLLKQKTFTRSEIAHLTDLLQSRAAELTSGDTSRINVLPAFDSGRQKEFTSCVSEGNRNDGIRSPTAMFAPTHNSKVLENDIASPAELAKAYMGSRPSQVSPSVLGIRNQLSKEDTLIASKSPIMPLTKKTSFSLGAAENGFITPRSRGRSAIYNMARTPYSRVRPTSTLKGSGIDSGGYAGPSTSSSSLSPVENDENFESRRVTLKRRSSVLDDDVGSVGPMRRIKQKPNLLASRFHHTAHGVGLGYHAKQRPHLNGDERNKALTNSVENENESGPSTSYTRVPSKSREVAAKILQQLEKISPKEQSSESKLAAVQEKSPSKLISRLPGQALRSMEDVGSSKLLLNVQDDHKSGNKINGTQPDVHDSSPQKQGKAVGNDPNVSIVPSGKWNPVLHNDSAVSLKASTSGIGAADSFVKNGASQPQKKRAFRMSAEEVSLEQDDAECNGIASRSLSENKRPLEFPHTKPAEESKTTNQSEDKSFFGLLSSSTREHSPGAITFGVPASEGTKATSQTQNFASPVPLFDKPKEVNSSHIFGFSSKAADKFPLLASESVNRAESEPERSSSLANISTSLGSEVRTPETDTGFHLKPVQAVDTNGKCDDVSPAALNGPSVSFPAASFSDMNRISTGSVSLFTSSTSITNFVSTGSSTSTAAPSSGSIFGSSAKFLSSVGTVLKDGSSVDLSVSTGVSAAPTASILGFAHQRAKIDINPSSGSSTSLNCTVAASAASSTGNSIFKLDSSFSNSTGNSLQGSLFSSATKSPVSVAGTISQGTSVGSASTAWVPAFNMNASGSVGSLSTPSISFGSTSSTPSDSASLVPAAGQTSSVFKFGETRTAVSEGSVVNSGTSATPSTFGFGFSSSSLSNGPATAVFNFGGASVSPSAINTGSSPSSGTSAGIYRLGGSSSASSSTSNLVSSSTGAPSNVVGSGWQSSKSSVFGSSSTSASLSTTGFSFSASTNAAAPMGFNSSIGASLAPVFSVTTASASALSSPSLPNTQAIFGNPPTGGGFGASPGNNDQMNTEDSMAEDPVSSSATVSTPLFGQPSFTPSPPTFAFGSSAPPQNSAFMFNGQQNQAPPQTPPPFQALGSLEFNGGGGSFSLGSGAGDKSGRKIVKINRNKNRKK